MKILKRIRKIYHEDGNFIGYKINRHGELVIDKIYQSIDGKEFDNQYECKNYEKRIKLIKKLKKTFGSVFTNGDQVLESIMDGLSVMLEKDRKTILNGFKLLTIEKNKNKEEYL